jgi:dienelactone hydrolase
MAGDSRLTRWFACGCPQEWWGVTDIIKDQAVMLSKEGFRCLVPDLYKGKIGVDAEEAHHVRPLPALLTARVTVRLPA